MTTYLYAGEGLMKEVLDCAGVAEVERELTLLYERMRCELRSLPYVCGGI